MYTRAARNRRSSAFVNRSLLKSKFRCIRMFSVVRQCTLCVLYASTLRSVLRVLSYSRVSSSVAPTPSSIGRRNERAKHEMSLFQNALRASSSCTLYSVLSLKLAREPESLGSVLCVSCDSGVHMTTHAWR